MKISYIVAVIFLVLPIFRIIKYGGMKHKDYPQTDKTVFDVWKRLKIKSELFLFIGLWTPVLMLFGEARSSWLEKLFRSAFPNGETAILLWMLSFALPALIFLSISAVFGTKANKVKPETLSSSKKS